MSIFISKKLRYFMTIMEVRNFSKASEILCITRSPLSKSITEIEDSLGEKLFIRKHNDLIPTSVAQDYYDKCTPIYHDLLRLGSDKVSKSSKIIVDISIPYSFINYISKLITSITAIDNIERKVVTLDDFISLSSDDAKMIFTLREESVKMVHSVVSWDTGEMILLSPVFNSNNSDKLYIWKERNNLYLKEKYKSIAREYINDVKLIEHNMDVPSLLYILKRNGGNVLITYKIAVMYKLDGLKITRIKNYKGKFFVYHAMPPNRSECLSDIRKIISDFF